MKGWRSTILARAGALRAARPTAGAPALYEAALGAWLAEARRRGEPPLPELADRYPELCVGEPVFDAAGAVKIAPSAGARKRRGIYYTPPAVVAAALEVALDGLPARGRVCDPACGTGHFLAAVAGRRPDAQLYGVDRDPLAVEICAAVLAGRAPRLWVGDALTGPIEAARPEDAGLLCWAAAWPEVFAAGGFDAVVGNPPYRAGRLAGAPEVLRARIPTAEYQLDPYLLFLDRALRLTRVGGRVALVVPNSWLSNRRAGRLRRWALGHNTLEAIIEVPAEAFPAGVETVIALFLRGGRTAATVPVTGLAGDQRGRLVVDPARPEATPPLARRPAAAALVRASARWAQSLGDVARVARGVNPYHHTTHSPAEIEARIHHAAAPGGPGWLPELRGRHLPAPYRIDWGGDAYIHYGPWLKEPRDPALFEGPRLVVRKILGRTVHGAWLEAPFVCDQSVYVVRFHEGQPWSPWTVLACLNSQLMAELLRTRHHEGGRLFPQLKVGELRAAPLPPVDPRGALAREVARRAQGSAGGADADLEAMVAELYGVLNHWEPAC